jgi:hypothetical protein
MRFQLRGFTSLLLTWCFLVLSVSGVMLYFTPRGRVANWTGWTLIGLEKGEWQAVHMNLALLFLIVTGLHLYLNWGLFWSYLKKKASLSLNLKTELLVATLLTAGVLAGTIVDVSPFGALTTYNERIKDYWEREPITAPMPHAEELTLSQLARSMGLSVEPVLEALRQGGLVVEDETATIAQLAAENRSTPSAVYALVKQHFPEAPEPGTGRGMGRGEGGRGAGDGRGGGMGLGKGQGRGMGRGRQE